MSRIEDNEAERAERTRQERKLQEQQLSQKKVAEAQQFRNFVAQGQQLKKQDAHGDRQRSEDKQAAGRLVTARRGYDANTNVEQRLRASGKDNDANRSRLHGKDLERGAARQALGQALLGADGQKSGKSDPMGIGRSGGHKGGDGGGQQDARHKDAGRNDAAQSPGALAQSYTAIGQAAVQALDGMGAKTQGRGVSAADQAERVRAMVDAIVKGVRQGMDEQGFGLIEVSLNDDVLGGAKLIFLHRQEGIELKIETNELGQAQHERPNETLLKSNAHELSQALHRADIKLLGGLEINGEKVLSSQA